MLAAELSHRATPHGVAQPSVAPPPRAAQWACPETTSTPPSSRLRRRRLHHGEARDVVGLDQNQTFNSSSACSCSRPAGEASDALHADAGRPRVIFSVLAPATARDQARRELHLLGRVRVEGLAHLRDGAGRIEAFDDLVRVGEPRQLVEQEKLSFCDVAAAVDRGCTEALTDLFVHLRRHCRAQRDVERLVDDDARDAVVVARDDQMTAWWSVGCLGTRRVRQQQAPGRTLLAARTDVERVSCEPACRCSKAWLHQLHRR